MLVLERFAWTPTGVFGRLHIAGGETLYTVECPWRENIRSVSCIPEGRYTCRRGDFRGLYPDLELEGVPDRSAIEVHIANTAGELRGCIAPGVRLGVVDGQWAVVASRVALERLMASIPGDREVLWVTRVVMDDLGVWGELPIGAPVGAVAGD